MTLLSDGDNKFEQEIPITSSEKNRFIFKIKEPKLWWPNGEGKQNLYTLDVKIIKNDVVLDKIRKKVGIRTVELILKEKDKATFKFRVNNKDIYGKGVNWIPADSFLPRVKKEKYFELLSLAKQGQY